MSHTNAHDENHLLLQLAVVIILWAHFPIEVEELLQGLVFGWKYILDDWHQELGLLRIGR